MPLLLLIFVRPFDLTVFVGAESEGYGPCEFFMPFHITNVLVKQLNIILVVCHFTLSTVKTSFCFWVILKLTHQKMIMMAAVYHFLPFTFFVPSINWFVISKVNIRNLELEYPSCPIWFNFYNHAASLILSFHFLTMSPISQ